MSSNTCKQCGKQTNNPSFCNKSCAASYNNRGVRRHGRNTNNCPDCGGHKDLRAKVCRQCSWLRQLERSLDKPIGAITRKNSAPRAKYVQIRVLSRRWLSVNRDKECVFCEDQMNWPEEILEGAHLVPLHTFSDKQLIREAVVGNTEWMCPNHHKMYDAGLLGSVS